MVCNRCSRPKMIYSQRVETEHAGPFTLSRLYQVWECGDCSMEVIVITPYIMGSLERSDHA